MFSGYELLFCSLKHKLRNIEDVFVIAVHCNLVNNGFKCLALGDKASSELETAQESELLPEGWNSDTGVYSLFYRDVKGRNTHLLKVVSCDAELMVHFVRMKDNKMGDATFKCSDFCTGDLSDFSKAYKGLEDLEQRLDAEVLQPLKGKSSAASTASQQQSHTQQQGAQTHDPLRTGPPAHDPLRAGPPRQGGYRPGWPGHADPLSVGRGDLDPLAGPSAGGMLLDPMQAGRLGRHDPEAGGLGMPGRLPRGSVPPGARFDPIGPPDLDRRGYRAGPDPDHMRPPGFEDDMYM